MPPNGFDCEVILCDPFQLGCCFRGVVFEYFGVGIDFVAEDFGGEDFRDKLADFASATLEVPFWDMWCWSARLFRCMSVRGLPSVGICGCPDPGCTGRSGMGRSSVSLGGVGSRRAGTALSG